MQIAAHLYKTCSRIKLYKPKKALLFRVLRNERIYDITIKRDCTSNL